MTQGNTLARYEVLRELGRGARTAVYAARDRSSGAVIALKILDPTRPDASLADRFLRHARSAQRLTHGNIVGILAAGEADGIAYIAMEMLEGESLRKILDRGPLPVARAIRIAHDIAAGLGYAHLEGVVHGGLAPSNIIVQPSGEVKVADFGIAQLGRYAAPEQIRGEPADHRSDIFSLGALLYEMLTNRAPFRGASLEEIAQSMLQADLPLPSMLNPSAPRALDQIVLRMLTRNPDDRLAGAPILQRDLEQLESRLGLATGPEPGSNKAAAIEPPVPPEAFDHREAMRVMEREARLPRAPGSGPAILASLALALAVLAVGISGFMYYSSSGREPPVVASRSDELPAATPAMSRPAAPPPEPEAPKESESAGAMLAQDPPPEPLPEVQPPVEDPQPTGAAARLVVAIVPRGDVYIDGEYHGTTPPTTTFDLEPGMHRIEVRSGLRKPYLTYMTIQAGDVRRIRHDFNAKANSPPGRKARGPSPPGRSRISRSPRPGAGARDS